MGNLAIKAFQYKEIVAPEEPGGRSSIIKPGRKKLLWEGESMRVTNFEKANEWVKGTYRKGWELK